MRTFKTRHQFYLPDDLSAKLAELSSKPGASKTAIMTDAFAAWLERRAGNELDQRFGVRLDRMSRADSRHERKLDFLSEAFGTFVQHQLTLVAHQPQFDPETATLGRQRYQAFLDVVGRRLAQPDRSPIRIEMAKVAEEGSD